MEQAEEDGEALRARRRAQVLRQCREAAEAWQRQPGRNLVLLFDGTGNILGNSQDTNVVKLLRLLRKVPPYEAAREQIVYYDPGVGTANDFPPAGIAARTRGTLRQLMGLVLGQGAFENIAEAYTFLCGSWQPGDRIFLFGFSRGAFTARAVAGMANMYGLVQSTGLPLVRALVRTYFAEPGAGRDAFAADVIANFSLGRTPLLHFTGVWDTVETIGLTGGVSITNSSRFEHKRFVHVRHALSLHETRIPYRPREYTAPDFNAREQALRSFDQRWFRGVHSDIGGSYAEDGLSNITLNWMIRESRACGLEVADGAHREDPLQPLHDQALDSPFWVLAGLDARDRRNIAAPIDPSALPLHDARPAQRHGGVLAKSAGMLLFVLAVVLGLLALRGVGGVLLDAAFFIAAWAWLPYPLAWALRRWCARAILQGRPLPVPASRAYLLLWLLLAAGVLSVFLHRWWPPRL
jgi:uncharacterized protein (DUF2235 family)